MNKGQVIGYARVSSYGQSLDVQEGKLEAYGCQKIFKEKRSGSRQDNRPELSSCLEYVREGDVLVVCKLDRLARSVRDLQKITEQLEAKQVALVILDQQIDTSTPSGKLLFNMLSAIAEFENDLRRERQLEGIAKAKEKGVRFGASKKLSEEQVEDLKRAVANRGDTPMSVIAADFGIGKATLYRYL